MATTRLKHYSEFKNEHEGETGVIICNGPSLKDVDDEFLYKYPTFGTNMVALRKDFAPTYFVGIGYDHFDNQERRQMVHDIMDHPNLKALFINRDQIHEFRYSNAHQLMSPQNNSAIKYYEDGTSKVQISWSDNPLHEVGVFGTTTYVELQIAAYMGFKTILLVGCDHFYDVEDPHGQHFYEQGKDDLKYDPPAYPWKNIKEYQVRSEIAYMVAKSEYERLEKEIINITPNSHLDVFETGNIEDWR